MSPGTVLLWGYGENFDSLGDEVVFTDAPDRNFFNIGVGLSATFRGGVSAFVSYETVLGLENITRHSVTMGVRKEL